MLCLQMSPSKRPSPKIYSLGEVMRLTGAKRPQIEYWVRKSIIRGEFEDGGTGLPRQFVFRNLVEVAIALDLNRLGVNTEVMSAMVDAVRYGDVDADVRTPWFARMTAPRRPLRFSKAPKHDMKAALAAADAIPLEDRCCAELNDDGTLTLLKLLRAYVDAGVSDVEIRKALLAVAREHVREHQQWRQDYDALHRRWRAFKNPATRPRTGQFWIVCELPEFDGDTEDRWRRTRLTDDRDQQRSAVPSQSLIVVRIRPILEQLEAATDDSWRATPERRVFKVSEPLIPPRQLVAQAFREYERTDGKKSVPASQQVSEAHQGAS